VEEIQKIKDRIAKLLRMANDTSSPEEAAIAMRRARTLMDQHQLDVSSFAPDQKSEMKATPVTELAEHIPDWINFLSTAVAQYNDCQSRFWMPNGDTRKCVVFLGLALDVELAQSMLESLVNQIDRLCIQHFRGSIIDDRSIPIIESYKLGASNLVSYKLNEMRREREVLQITSSVTGRALVLAKKSRVEEKFGKVQYEPRKSEAPESIAALIARIDGELAGDRVQIFKGIDNE
jgi:hypothetical protein